MNKLFILLACVLTIQFTAIASDNKSIQFHQLPEPSQQLIKKHFDGQSIALIKIDRELMDTSYEVIFTNGNKVEFNRKGIWKEIKSKYAPFPMELIPEEIKKYISESFPDSRITQIERGNKKGYEVELNNGIELTFDSKLRLQEIDY